MTGARPPAGSWRRRSAQRGSVTIVVAGVLSAVLVLSLGAADLARVLVTSARAQTAADAAALAAAQELAVPSEVEPSDAAAEYASRNGGLLVSCSCPDGGSEATVEVRVAVGPLLLFADDRAVRAAARAVVELPAPT
jgi:secretion/DNA translocation related TadE-like protein